MSSKNRFLTSFLIISLLFSAIPVYAFSSENSIEHSAESVQSTGEETIDMDSVSEGIVASDELDKSDDIIAKEEAATISEDIIAVSEDMITVSEDAATGDQESEEPLSANMSIDEALNEILEQSGEGAYIKQVELGDCYSAALTNTGELWTWGSNKKGQLGDGTTTNHDRPIHIKSGTIFKTISLGKFSGYGHGGAIDNDGNLWMWGYNYNGQLGDGTTTDHYEPVHIKKGTAFKTLSLGHNHSGAIDSSGNLWMWGDNSEGQLGDGTTTNHYEPVKVKQGTSFMALSLGENYSGAIDSSGNLWMWGDNGIGQLGDGTTTESKEPIIVKSGTEFKSLSLGFWHSGAIDSSGNLWMWGRGAAGQLGNGKRNTSYTPINIKQGTSFKALSLGEDYSGAIDSSGNLWMWGYNKSGQIGDGATSDRLEPIQIKQGTSFGNISLGTSHSGAIDTVGNLWMWGSNGQGRLGDGTTTDTSTPIKITIEGTSPKPLPEKLYIKTGEDGKVDGSGKKIDPDVLCKHEKNADIVPYYEFDITDERRMVNISVEFDDVPTVSQNLNIYLYKKGTDDIPEEIKSLKDDRGVEITNPYSENLKSGTKILFRRILLGKGKYYISVYNKTKEKGDAEEFGFSKNDRYGIYVTTYREGFDLTKDTLPVANEYVLFDLKSKQGPLPRDFFTYVFGKESVKKYHLEEENWIGYCFGLSCMSTVYKDHDRKLISEYLEETGRKNAKWGPFCHEVGNNSISYPSMDTGSSLYSFLGAYQVWQQFSSQADDWKSKYRKYYTNGISKVNYSNIEASLNSGKPLLITAYRYFPTVQGHTVVTDICRTPMLLAPT